MIQPKQKTVVKCQDVIFGYSTNKPILKGVSLELYQGESTVLFGGSGSGKSTLLRCISGYNQPEFGDIFVNKLLKVDIDSASSSLNPDNQYAYEIAELWQQMQSYKPKKEGWWNYFFQGSRSSQGYMVFADCSNALPQLTAEENLHLVLAPICPDLTLRRKTARLLLQLIGLTQVAQQKPSELSSGQLRRLCLAQGLAINPGLLILDEPTNGLDFSTKCSFLYFVEQLRQIVGITILSVTHDLEAALLLADRLLLFRDGKIVKEVDVEQPHPRAIEVLDTATFLSLRQMLTDFLR